jgi:hypothetical protein
MFIAVGVGAGLTGAKYAWDSYQWIVSMQEQGKVRVVITYVLLGIKKWLAEHPDIMEKLGSPPLQFDEQGIGLSVADDTAVITLPMAGRFARAFATLELVRDSSGMWNVKTLLVDCVDGTRLDLVEHLPQILRTYDSNEYMARWEQHQKDQQARSEGRALPSEQKGSLERLNDLFKPSDGTHVDETDKREGRTKEIEDKSQSLLE